MGIIDEKGRLFGKINVIDLLVVVVVAGGIVVASTTLAPFLDEEPAPAREDTAFVQLAFDGVPQDKAAMLTEGASGDGIELTDTFRFALGSDRVQIYAKARVAGQDLPDPDAFRRHGRDLRNGEWTLERIGGSTFNATVVFVGGGPDLRPLDTRTPYLVALDEVPAGDAETIGEGDVGTIGSDLLFDVEETITVPAGPAASSVYATGDVFRYGGPLPSGVSPPPIANASVDVAFPGIQASGRAFPTSRLPQDAPVVEERGIRVRVSDPDRRVWERLAVGAEEARSDTTLATVRDAATAGDETWVDLTVRTVRLGDRIEYKGHRLTPNRSISFRSDEVAFSGTVQTLDPKPWAPDNVTATIRVVGVAPEVAGAIRVGQVERTAAGDVLVRTVDRTSDPTTRLFTDPTTGVLRTQPHPVNRTLTLTVDVGVRSGTTAPTFKDVRFIPGARVPLFLGGLSVEGVVVEVAG